MGDGSFRLGNYSSVRHWGIRDKSANQSIPASTSTQVTFGSVYDPWPVTGVSWDNSSGQNCWVIAKPGIYLFIVNIEWDSTNVAANSRRVTGIFLNGTAFSQVDWSSQGFIQTLNSEVQQCVATIPCVVGDRVSVQVYVGGGSGTPVIGGDSARTNFSCAFIGQ
jgi:hypothetical protein